MDLIAKFGKGGRRRRLRISLRPLLNCVLILSLVAQPYLSEASRHNVPNIGAGQQIPKEPWFEWEKREAVLSEPPTALEKLYEERVVESQPICEDNENWGGDEAVGAAQAGAAVLGGKAAAAVLAKKPGRAIVPRVVDIPDPSDSQKTLRLTYDIDIQKTRASKWWPKARKMAKELFSQLRQHAGRGAPAFRYVVREVPPQFLGPIIGLGLALHSQFGEDPRLFLTYFEENWEDTVAILGFIGFAIVADMTRNFGALLYHEFYKFYDPSKAQWVLRDIGPVSESRALVPASGVKPNPILDFEPRIMPTQIHKLFGWLVSPMSIAMGSLTASLITDVLNDHDLWLCAKSIYKKDLDSTRVALACERSFETWTFGSKAEAYTPQLWSLVFTTGMQTGATVALYSAGAYGARGLQALRQGLSGERGAISVVAVKGFKLGDSLKSVFSAMARRPWLSLGGGFVMLVVQNAAFEMIRTNIVEPMCETEFIEDLPHWVVANALPHCDREAKRKTAARELRNRREVLDGEFQRLIAANYQWSPVLSSEGCDFEGCNGRSHHPAWQLLRYTERSRTWRMTELARPRKAYASWQKYVNSFASQYKAMTQFYSYIAGEIFIQRNQEKFPTSQSSLFLSKSGELFQFHKDDPDAHLYREKEMGKKELEFFRATLEDAAGVLMGALMGKSKEILAEEFEKFSRIKQKLLYFDDDTPLPSEVTDLYAGKSQAEKDVIAIRWAERQFREGVEDLMGILAEDVRWRVYDRNRGSIEDVREAIEQAAAKNPYARLARNLGLARGLTPASAVFLGSTGRRPRDFQFWEQSVLGSDFQVDASAASEYPSSLAQFWTDSPQDYLLVSMVCGKKMYKSKADFATLYYTPGPSYNPFSWIFGGTPPAPTDAELEAAYKKHVFPERSYWAPLTQDQSVGQEWKNIDFRFRPPRVVASTPIDFCTTPPTHGTRQFAIHRSPGAALHDPLTSEWRVKVNTADPATGQTIETERVYHGLLEVVLWHLDPEFLEGSTQANNSLGATNWFKKYLDPHVQDKVNEYAGAFEHFLKKSLIPAMESKETLDPGLRKEKKQTSWFVLPRLAPTGSIYKTASHETLEERTYQIGIFASLNKELDRYERQLDLLMRSSVQANIGKPEWPGGLKELQVRAKAEFQRRRRDRVYGTLSRWPRDLLPVPEAPRTDAQYLAELKEGVKAYRKLIQDATELLRGGRLLHQEDAKKVFKELDQNISSKFSSIVEAASALLRKDLPEPKGFPNGSEGPLSINLGPFRSRSTNPVSIGEGELPGAFDCARILEGKRSCQSCQKSDDGKETKCQPIAPPLDSRACTTLAILEAMRSIQLELHVYIGTLLPLVDFEKKAEQEGLVPSFTSPFPLPALPTHLRETQIR